MPIHGSERLRNVSRTVIVYLVGLALGAPVVHAGDDTFDSSAASAFVRVRVDASDGAELGRLSGDPATLASFVVVAEVYVRNGEGEPSVAVDAVESVAEAVQHALRARSLDLVDYVADASGATLVTGHAVRFTEPPRLQHAPTIDGWQRRIVVATGWWVLRHTV